MAKGDMCGLGGKLRERKVTRAKGKQKIAESANLLVFGVQLLAESNAELLAETLESLNVLLVLLLGLDLGLDACCGC